jgi:hypothetical protein
MLGDARAAGGDDDERRDCDRRLVGRELALAGDSHIVAAAFSHHLCANGGGSDGGELLLAVSVADRDPLLYRGASNAFAVNVYCVASGRVSHRLTGHDACVTAVCWLPRTQPRGAHIVTVGDAPMLLTHSLTFISRV